MRKAEIVLCLAASLVFGVRAIAHENSPKPPQPHLIEYTWRVYYISKKMDPLIRRLEREEHVCVRQYDIYESSKAFHDFNEWSKVLERKRRCSGIPFFINTRNLQTICGAADYATLHAWALSDKQ